MIDTGLRGKVVLVTGANHGIGAATAKAFEAVGAPIFINYLGAPSPESVVRTIREAGGTGKRDILRIPLGRIGQPEG